MTRYALLTRGGEPYIWDFGSAAKHHRLNCPWLLPNNIRAGMIGLRGAVAPEVGLAGAAAREIKQILIAEGVADMPLGVDILEPTHARRPAEARHRRPRRPADDARRPPAEVATTSRPCSTRPARWSTACTR